MSSKKGIKTRIKTVQNTKKVTRAMKLISTIKLKQVQNSSSAARPYNQQLAQLISKTIKNIDFAQLDPTEVPALLHQSKEASTACLVVVTSDRGLCGPYNSAVFKVLTQRVNELKAQGKKVKLITFGGKANSYARRALKDLEIIKAYLNLPVTPGPEVAKEAFELIQNGYIAGELSSLEIIYSRFISMMKSGVTIAQVLPFTAAGADHKELEDEQILFEPKPLEVVAQLIPLYCQNQIYQALLSGRASELAHRVNAMSAATDNANALIEQLTLTYNKARQASITQEISEIVAGAESVL
jgi:F-type H+-transporting ATPase subunit gamma